MTCNVAQPLHGPCNGPIITALRGGFFLNFSIFAYFCSVAAHESGTVTVTSEGARTKFKGGGRVGVRSGNNANNSNLSARYLNANNTAGNTNSYYCGSAKV